MSNPFESEIESSESAEEVTAKGSGGSDVVEPKCVYYDNDALERLKEASKLQSRVVNPTSTCTEVGPAVPAAGSTNHIVS